ncbi:hypothetical protein CSZ94_17315 [Janthinobacterium sp. ROICE36]|nr:hypothetical protein CSZ94_17315 [Janthinobacterium sp. ROICE36]
MGEIRAFAARMPWSADEICKLTECYATSTRATVALIFPGRKTSSIESKAHWMGLSRPVKPGRTAAEVLKAKRESMARRRALDLDVARSQIGGRLLARPGSRRRDWICAGCAADLAVIT